MGTPRGHQGASGDVGGVRGVLGAGRDSMYSVARRGIGAPMGCRGHLGVSGASGGVRDVLGLAGTLGT